MVAKKINLQEDITARMRRIKTLCGILLT